MSQNLVPNKVIVTLMTLVVVSYCKNRKVPHNKAPVSQMGSCVDGHPQGNCWSSLPLFGSFFFFFSFFFFEETGSTFFPVAFFIGNTGIEVIRRNLWVLIGPTKPICTPDFFLCSTSHLNEYFQCSHSLYLKLHFVFPLNPG